MTEVKSADTRTGTDSGTGAQEVNVTPPAPALVDTAMGERTGDEQAHQTQRAEANLPAINQQPVRFNFSNPPAKFVDPTAPVDPYLREEQPHTPAAPPLGVTPAPVSPSPGNSNPPTANTAQEQETAADSPLMVATLRSARSINALLEEKDREGVLIALEGMSQDKLGLLAEAFAKLPEKERVAPTLTDAFEKVFKFGELATALKSIGELTAERAAEILGSCTGRWLKVFRFLDPHDEEKQKGILTIGRLTGENEQGFMEQVIRLWKEEHDGASLRKVLEKLGDEKGIIARYEYGMLTPKELAEGFAEATPAWFVRPDKNKIKSYLEIMKLSPEFAEQVCYEFGEMIGKGGDAGSFYLTKQLSKTLRSKFFINWHHPKEPEWLMEIPILAQYMEVKHDRSGTPKTATFKERFSN